MTPEDMAARFNRDLSRAVRFFSKWSEAAKQFIELHKRHGQIVESVVVQHLQKNAVDLLPAVGSQLTSCIGGGTSASGSRLEKRR